MINREDIQDIVNQHRLSAWGISPPTLREKYRRMFDKWLKRGYQGEMNWISRNSESRKDIQNIFPWAKSVLVVLDNYYSPSLIAKNGIRVSRYVHGIDYHTIVREKLENVLNSMRNIDRKIEGRVYVDSGPVQEKAFAEQAGLGWIGKNGVLIGHGIGSFCFIGILILSIYIEPSKSVDNLCGDCKKCIDACPNAAIVEPGLIDCKRCISYLSVEKKTDLNPSECKMLGQWVYGCDICQEICPWNQKWQKPSRDERYSERKDLIKEYIELGNRAKMDKFEIVFGDTPAKRPGFEQMKRNMRAVLENA